MRSTLAIGVGLWVASLGAARADGVLDEPLALSNRHPLVQIYGLPDARSGAITGAGEARWRIAYDRASDFAVSSKGGESIVLDGETQRLELGARYGLGQQWEVGFALPVIRHSGGDLDSFIEGWHNFWGLPKGDRPDYPRNRLNYRYTRNGHTLLDFHDAESGIGDAQLNAAYSLGNGEGYALALGATVSLPTGDADKLTGSGATNASLVLAGTAYEIFGTRLTANGNIGVLGLGDGDVLTQQQKSSVWFGSMGLSWAAGQNWRLKAQVDAHTAFYDSALTELGSDSAQLLLGGSVRLSRHWLLDIAVAEDIAVDTAPDVTFQLALRASY